MSNAEKKEGKELTGVNKTKHIDSQKEDQYAKELNIAKKELLFQHVEKQKRAAELIIANIELDYQKDEKEKRADELLIANEELIYQNSEKENRADELIIANKELIYQNSEKENRASELVIANKELAFQNKEKEKRAAELIIANKELIYQNAEKENRASELIIANKELAFQNKEKEKRADELHILNEQLRAKEQQLSNHIHAIAVSNASIEFDLEGNILNANENFLEIMGYTINDLKGKHHSLFVDKVYAASSDYKLFWNDLKRGIYQKDEFKRIGKQGQIVWLLGSYNPILDIAGKPYKILKLATDVTLAKTQFLELALQAKEKENRASELIIANKELAFQNTEKEKRAAELIIANKELAFQSKEKEKRAAELIIANKKLALETIQKEKRKAEKEKAAAALIVTNRELAYQEKRGKELFLANSELKKAQEELEAFSYSVSHDLRAPIRAINGYTQILLEDHATNIDDDGQRVLQSVIHNSRKMGLLIDDLLAFSKLGRKQVSTETINMASLLNGVISEIGVDNSSKIPVFEIESIAYANGDPALIKQVWINLISNAIKYSQYKPEIRIKITSFPKEDNIVYCVKDFGAGFDMEYYDKLFGVFQRLHSQEEFDGTGIGLAIVQKIINRHHGTVWAESELDQGATFYFSLPIINI
ncbi:PAS domain S-box-containing protein [Flavobacterium sp. 90]|uniref:PAS domain-containing sensor histidine kinase n=1 Tax=unclassified Flavobacterium TaxID=196869 RepID=UPI000F1283D6|nr:MULTISPECIES: ATP-binding protein [unclassified Flavobacterium]RKR08989.1 PAS domain S-box-containing protein [Flavobacterium sp. 81]TCK52776.1 PAS domain S-box-containing protein [Flavobacterium sp. 90]